MGYSTNLDVVEGLRIERTGGDGISVWKGHDRVGIHLVVTLENSH
jgi:hypothetical protein